MSKQEDALMSDAAVHMEEAMVKRLSIALWQCVLKFREEELMQEDLSLRRSVENQAIVGVAKAVNLPVDPTIDNHEFQEAARYLKPMFLNLFDRLHCADLPLPASSTSESETKGAKATNEQGQATTPNTPTLENLLAMSRAA